MYKTQYTLKKQFTKKKKKMTKIFSSPDFVAHNTDEKKKDETNNSD